MAQSEHFAPKYGDWGISRKDLTKSRLKKTQQSTCSPMSALWGPPWQNETSNRLGEPHPCGSATCSHAWPPSQASSTQSLLLSLVPEFPGVRYNLG